MSPPNDSTAAPAFLDARRGEQRVRLPLVGATVTLGRHPGCDLRLESDAVSRRHARLIRSADGWRIEDLGSRNGTRVNGTVIAGPTALCDGDAVTLCDWELVFHSPPAGGPGLSVTMVEEPTAAGRVVSTLDVSETGGVSCATDPAAALRAVLDVNAALGSSTDVGAVLDRVLERLFDVYPGADHGVILLRDQSGVLRPRASRSRGDRGGEVRVSRTVVDRVLQRRQAILSADLASDDQFDASRSLAVLPIRSLMCAPILSRSGEPMGVIEIHSEAAEVPFAQSCLDVLSSVASAAGIAIENARLHGELLARAHLERDLQRAREVQASFLPAAPPAIDGYAFYVHYASADTVGGDYYGYLALPEGRMAIAVGDVSGKGMSAALMMARLSSDVRSCLLQHAEPARAVQALNESLLSADVDGRFVTFVLLVLDIERGRVTVVNAGHPRPLLRLAGGEVRAIDGAGVPLGVSAAANLQAPAVEVELPPGALLVAYTDGLTEARGEGGALLGEAAVRRTLAAAGPGVEAAGEALVALQQSFVGRRPASDDTTIVVAGRAAEPR